MPTTVEVGNYSRHVHMEDAHSQILPDADTYSKRLLNASSPCGRIPPEVLCHIFSFAKWNSACGWPRIGLRPRGHLKRTTWSRDTLIYIPGWLTVTYVCWRWREVAVGTPRLWADPDDYLALPQALLLPILTRSGDVPFRLHLSSFSFNLLYDWRRPRVFMPSPFSCIGELRISLFDTVTYNRFAPHIQIASQQLRKVDIQLDLEDEEEPLRLSSALCSSSAVTHLRLCDSLPSSWDAPIFSAHLTHLTLGLPQDLYLPHLVPTALEFLDLLASSASLEVLTLNDVFPTTDARRCYPSMTLPLTLRSLSLTSTNSAPRHVDCLTFLSHLELRRDILLRVFMMEHLAGVTVDFDIAAELVPLISSALHSICRQQSPHKQIVFSEQAFITLADEDLQFLGEDCPYIDEIEQAHAPLLSFSFQFAHITDITSWHGGSASILLRGVRSASFSHSGGGAYLQDEVWQRAFVGATDVCRISVYISDCAALSPLAVVTSEDGVATFRNFPNLNSISICVAEPAPSNPTESAELLLACQESLETLQAILNVRRKNGARLESLVVDVALSDWMIWDALQHVVPITFRALGRERP